MFLEIDFAQPAAICLNECIDLVRDLAFIENVAAAFPDQSQCVSQRRILENIAFGWRPPLTIEGISLEKGAGQTFVDARAECPIVSNQLGDRETLFGVMNGGRKIIAQFQSPEFFVQLEPCIDCARHADRQHSSWGNRVAF